MKVNISKLPYRKGVQAYIVNNKDELLLVTNRGDDSFWKVPSGGCENKEIPKQTVIREMKEELSVKIEIIKMCSFKNKYTWPEHVIRNFKYQYKGQEQYIFIVRIKNNQKIKIEKKEIGKYKWVAFNNLNQYFKLKDQRIMAKKVLNEYLKLKTAPGEN